MGREPGKHRAPRGRHRQAGQDRVYIVKYETNEGLTLSDPEEFTDKDKASARARELGDLSVNKKAWVE